MTRYEYRVRWRDGDARQAKSFSDAERARSFAASLAGSPSVANVELRVREVAPWATVAFSAQRTQPAPEWTI